MVKEVKEIAKELCEHWSITDYEALNIAVKIQQNRLFKEAYVLGSQSPGALEAIAIQLGIQGHTSIPNAISSISDAINSK
jgi:hypothetical protein